jgi:hypothetical protein
MCSKTDIFAKNNKKIKAGLPAFFVEKIFV